jgi:hypothetical protein
MKDLAALTADDFTPHSGSRFVVAAEPETGIAEPIPLELAAVTAFGGRPRGAFSLVFRGPAGLYLPQRIYHLEHDALGPLDIFLVPIQPTPDGSFFEAVFN